MASEGQTSLGVVSRGANCVLGLSLPLFKEIAVVEFTMCICGSNYQTVSPAELHERTANLTSKAFLIAIMVILHVEFSTLKFHSPVGEKRNQREIAVFRKNNMYKEIHT